jgi:Holliday junction resolvase-like predicted endonuclease
MYNGNMQAREKGKWITIVKAKSAVNAKKGREEAKPVEPEKQERLVKAKKAWLYDSPKMDEVTKLYLIENDKFIILEQKNIGGLDWYFIRFIGVKIVEKWIKASDTKAVDGEYDSL